MLIKKNICDLRKIINESLEYTAVHASGMCIEFLVYTYVWYFDVDPSLKSIRMLVLLVGIHCYALMIHKYNRLLAGEQIERIKFFTDSDCTDKVIPIFPCPSKINELLIYSCFCADGNQPRKMLYYLSYFYTKIGPYFKSIEELNEYVIELIEKYNINDGYDAYIYEYLGKLPVPKSISIPK